MISVYAAASLLSSHLGFVHVHFQVNQVASIGFPRRQAPTFILVNFLSIKPKFLGVCVALLLECVFCLSFRSVLLCFCLVVIGFIRCWIC